MPKYSVKDPDSGVTLTLEGDSPPTEQELEQVFAEYGKKQKTLTQPEPITPQKGSWFERQAPLKGASQEIGKLPGKFLETLGTVAEVAGPSIESAIGDPGSVPKTSRTPAQVIQDVQANPLVKVGRRSQQEAIARVPLTPQEETGITTKIGRGAGGMLPYVVAGPAAPALIGLESFSDHLTNDFDTEKANGKSDDEAAKIAFTKGITSGGIQATIFALLPKPLRNLGDKWLIDRYGSAVIKRFLASRAANAGEGATLFAASRISENALDGEDLSKGLLESAGSGAALLGLTPRGQPPEQQRRRVIEQQFPPAPPGAAPPQIPNLPVPIEPGPIGAIPEGGTIPQRTRIRLTLPEKGIPNDQTQTQRPENQVNAPSALPPLGQGQSADITPKIETQGGVAQPKGQDQTATELKIPPAEELATKSPDEFDLFFRSLGTRKQEAQQQTANTTSPVRLRQYATEAANDYTRLRNEIASKQKAGSNVTIPEMETVGKVSTKLQYFNEALREAGEQPVQPPESTIETQVGKRKKPSGGRTPGMTPREAGLIKGQEKLENDWSVAVRSGKQQVNADELKTGDTVVVRGEPLTVQSINPDDGAVRLKGEKEGRWGERQLQAGQQIGVDNYEPSKEAKFETGASVSETTPGVQQVSGAGVPKVGGSAAEQIETVKPNETRTQILSDLEKGKIQASTGLTSDEIAIYDISKTIKLPNGWSVKDNIPSKYGSHYWQLEDPDGDTWKVSLRDHSPSPLREQEFGSSDLSQYVDNAKDPKQFSVGLSQIEQRLYELASELPDIKERQRQERSKIQADAKAKAEEKQSVAFLKKRLADKEEAFRNGIRIGNGKPFTTENQKEQARNGIEQTRQELEQALKQVRSDVPISGIGGQSELTSKQQKYRVEGQGPQLYTLIERLPQSETEKNLGEQPVRVRNEKTGKEETVLETQLQAVQLRTSEEKAASKGMTKRELDDALRKFGMEPSEFSNSGQKREALKRARAKEREASIPKTANESLLRALSITKNTVEAQLGREPAIKQANLSEVVGEKPVYHETDLRGALEKYRRLRKEFDQGWTQFFVSDNIDLALGQSGKGITFELDPKRLNGWESKKPGTGERTGKEYWIDKSIFNAVDAIIFSNERQVEAFQRRHPNSLDYSKAVEADRGIVSGKGIRVPAKTHSVEDVGRQSSIELSKRSESSALTEFSTPEQIRLALRNTNRISEPHRKAIGWLVRSGMMDQLPGIRMEIVDYIRGGAVGEYVREDNVARFLAWTDADVPIHEFLHHVWRYLDDADRASIRALRLGEIAEKASQMGDTFTTGITSDYFVEKGFNRDLYHFSNDSEFFVWMMTEKALADMNKPQARTIVQKVNEIIRQLWNGFKDALGFSKYQDALWRQLLSNKYEYSFEDGRKFSESNDMRNLALVRSRRDAAEQAMNYDEMSDTQKRDIGSDIELQNTFVEPLATRLLQGVSRGIVSKLQGIFGDRLAALAETRGRGDRHDVGSYDELMANPSIEPETKQIIVGDMEKNLRDFRGTAEKTISLSDTKIQNYQQKIVRLTEDLDVQKARRDVLAAAARRIVSDYQNRYLARIRQGGQAGEATMGAEVMRQLQQLRQSPEIVGRIIDQIATTVPEDVLTRPGVTAPELLQALIENNGGNLETLSSAMGEAQRGVSREMLQVAIGIMQASDQLAENVLAIRPTINPEDVRQIESLAVELRDAARKGARADMRQLVREVGGTAQTLSMVRSAIGRLQPRIRRAARQLDEWMTTQEILEEARNDPALKSLEEKVYKHFDVRSVVVTQGGDHEFTMRNPLTNEEVKILPGLDKLNVQSNYGKLQKLFDDAAAYLANTQDKNYDPRLAAAWRYMIENTQQFWLNPSVNVFMPHMTPYQFDLPAFLSDPFKVLRPTAGLESNDAQVKLNAMSKIKKALMEWDRKTGATVDIDNKKAARASNMTLEDWYNNVFGEIAFRNQYLGQVIPKVGEVLLSGHIVTAADLAAGRTNFNYLKRLRDIAENAPGFTAAQINPVRVVEGGISRRAEPTGPMTLPSRRAPRTIQWGSQWRRLQDWQQRMTWLNDPERFNRIVVGHMDTYNTPGYTVLSAWRDSYKDMVTEIRRDQGPETIQEIAQRLYETQDLDELGQNAKTVDQIQQEIINEIDQGFNNFEAEGRDAQRQKPDPIVDALTAENSFTKPRSAKISAPFTFYDYGVRDYPGRVRMGNDVYAWYSLDFVKSLERLHAAFKQRIAALTEGLSPKEQTAVHKASKKAQRRGDEFFDLAELKLNAKRIATLLKQQTRVLQASRQGRSSLESVFYRAQSAVGSYILMTPGARSTHTFGMMGVSGVFNALVENAVVRPNAKAWYRLVSSAVKDVLKVPVSIPGVKITNEQLRSWSGVAQPYAEMVIRRREQMERLKELSIIPEGDVRGAWQSMVGDWKNVFRRGTPEKLSTRIIKAGTGLSDLHNAFWMAWSPQRYNDWILNSNIREMRQDFVRGLQENAVKHLRNRAEVLGTGYTDFSRPENVLTAQEITGHKGATAEREAFEKRKLFKVLGLDLDQIMLRYFRATDEAQASGQELRSIPFLTDAEEKSLDFEFAQGLGLSSPGNRNLAAQGSLLRRATGYIHGLPLSTMGKFLGLMNRLSNQSNPKYAQAVIPLVLMAGAYTTLMGLMRIQSTTALNRLFFNQSSALPTIGQAKTPDDWWRLLVRAQAGWWPGIGDIIMSAVLRTPDRFGHLDSMFVMWNFIQDVINMGGDMWHTKDIAGPLTKFGERWLPPIKIITRRLHSQSGVREHYNAVADIQSALPSSMETAAAKFRGGLRPTETTPLTYQALNAMYNGDWEEFDRIAQSYAQKKSDRGVKDGILAFKHSISAHNPWVERLGKLPSEDERQQVLSRMDDSQKQEVQKAEDTFRQFGQRYNTRVAFTVQQAEAEKGAAGGSGEPTAGIGNVKLPSISKIGNVNVPRRTSSGLRRISIGGAPSSKSFIGRPGGLRVSRPRRVSVGAVARPRRLVHGRLKGLAHRSTSSRKRRIRLSRV